MLGHLGKCVLVSKIWPKPSSYLTKKASAMQVYMYPEIQVFLSKDARRSI